MRAALAPVEARPAQHARRLAAAGAQRADVDADALEQRDADVGDKTRVVRELEVTAGHERIGERHAELAREVVVTRARRAQCRVARPGHRHTPVGLERGRDLHDAFQHLCDGRRREPVIAMAALLLHLHEIGGHHAREMRARRLRRDARGLRELRRGQRATVHQRMKHDRARRLAGERSDFRESGACRHACGRSILTA